MAPANPAMAPERAKTSTLEVVRFMPTVADAAGLSAMAIQRRANLERRSISSRKKSRAKMMARKMTNALRSGASLLIRNPKRCRGW